MLMDHYFQSGICIFFVTELFPRGLMKNNLFENNIISKIACLEKDTCPLENSLGYVNWKGLKNIANILKNLRKPLP